MSETNQNPDPNSNPEDQHDPIDETQQEGEIEVKPSTPDLDFRALYVESARDRGAKEERIRQLEEALEAKNKPASQEDEELDYERMGIDPAVGKALSLITRAETGRLKRELQASIQPLGEISESFKRQQAASAAETSFYQQYPHLVQYREALTPAVMQTMGNSTNVTPQEFARNAFAVIGMQAAMGAAQNPSTSTSSSKPSVRSTPPARVNGTPLNSGKSRTLTEIERTQMKKNNFDPNKREDIEAFFAIVENDEPMVIR